MLRARTALLVGGQCKMRLVAQNSARQPGQDRAGTDLKEQPRACFVHRLNGLVEVHRFGQVAAQLGTHLVGTARIRRGGGICINRTLRHANIGLGQCPAQKFACRGHAIGVETAGHGQALGGEPGLGQNGDGLFDIGRLARNYRLIGGVHIGQGHVNRTVQLCPDRFRPRVHGGHSAQIVTTRSDNRTAARMGQAQQGIRIERTRGIKRRELAKAVAGGAARLDPEAAQQVQYCDRNRTNGGLGHIGAFQLRYLVLALRLIQGGTRVNQVG